MSAELSAAAFSREAPPIVSGFWSESLNKLANQIHLQKLIKESGFSRIQILAIPSFRQQINEGKFNLYAPVSPGEKQGILEGLRLDPGTEIKSICRGGASVAAALSSAAEIANKDKDTLVVIVGAEALSQDNSGLKTGELVRNAGRSVFPQEAMGKTLSQDVEPSLITAYALRESTILDEKSVRLPGQILRVGKDIPPEFPSSGRIVPSEIAASADGAFLAVVTPSKDASDGKSHVYIALGESTPKTGNHINWWEMPSKFNMALAPIQNILSQSKLNSKSLSAELYECFFIAVVQQTAALLNIEEINNESIKQIYTYIENYKPLSNLREWASWGISSAEKAFLIWNKLNSAKSALSQNALLVSNGGVINEIAAVLLTTDLKLAQMSSFNETDPQMQKFELLTEKKEIAGKVGVIDMIAYQAPRFDKNGSLKQNGSTFARVVLPDKKVVLTNLGVVGNTESIYEDFTHKGAVIGGKVTLDYLNGAGSQIVATLTQLSNL